MVNKTPIKGILFDIGWTIAYPKTGTFLLPGSFYERTDSTVFGAIPEERKKLAFEKGMKFLEADHLVLSVDKELRQFVNYYMILSAELPELGITEEDARVFAREMAYAPNTILLYDGVKETLEKLRGRYRLGLVSDTWPSTERFITAWGIRNCFDAITFSCYLGVSKPDRRMYLDALGKIGLAPEETVFIDDSEENLDGAAACGIRPVLIRAKPGSQSSGKYPSISHVSEIADFL